MTKIIERNQLLIVWLGLLAYHHKLRSQCSTYYDMGKIQFVIPKDDQMIPTALRVTISNLRGLLQWSYHFDVSGFES